MRIAIDFDQTWSRDSETFRQVAECFQSAGHEVICVTGRDDTPENRETLAEFLPQSMRRYFTGGAMKAWYMNQRGISVTIWIDDDPTTIGRAHIP